MNTVWTRVRISIVLLALLLSACAALLRDSENFYKDMPRRRINGASI